MAFTKKTLPVSRHEYFRFFATDGDLVAAWGVAEGTMDEQFNPSCGFILGQIRVHLTTVHPSIVSFYVVVSHHIDSTYNEMLVSEPMLGVQDLVYEGDPERVFWPGDTFSIGMTMSGINTYGLEISGWAITQEVG